MSTLKDKLAGFKSLAIAQTIAIALLALGSAYGQLPGSKQGKLPPGYQKADLDAAVSAAESGKAEIGQIQLIEDAGYVAAIPALERQFQQAHDAPPSPVQVEALFGELDQLKLAAALIKLGDKNPKYWDYVENKIQPALASDAPNPIGLDKEGKEMPGTSPAFAAWAQSHNLTVEAAQDAVGIFSLEMIVISADANSRFIPFLRQGLSSPNYMIQSSAALGLAEIQDKDSIPYIIQACEKSSSGSASLMAQELVYFDDPAAQAAVDRFVPKDIAKMLREEKTKGHTPFY